MVVMVVPGGGGGGGVWCPLQRDGEGVMLVVAVLKMGVKRWVGEGIHSIPFTSGHC